MDLPLLAVGVAEGRAVHDADPLRRVPPGVAGEGKAPMILMQPVTFTAINGFLLVSDICCLP
jgi:hypothetical protein